MIPSFPVLGFVINHSVLDFDFANAEIALEVGGIVLCVPQAKFNRREYREFRSLPSMVRDSQLPDLKIFVERHEVARAGLDPVILRTDRGVAHAVTARVILEFAASGLPRWRPEVTSGIVSNIDIPSTKIERRVVVAITGDPAQARVTIKGITARRVGDDSKICLASQIVDPR